MVLLADTHLRSLHQDLVGDHACSWSSNPFGPHNLLCLVNVHQDGKRAVLWRLAVNHLFWRGTSCNIHRKLYIVIRLRRIGFGCSGFVLKVLDDCSGQVEHVPSMLITMGLVCNGLVLLPL